MNRSLGMWTQQNFAAARSLQLPHAKPEVWKVKLEKGCLCHPPVLSDPALSPWG